MANGPTTAETLAVAGIAQLASAATSAVPGLGAVSSALGAASSAALDFSGVNKDLINNLKLLSGLVSKDVGASITGLTEKLKGQINTFQELDKTIAQLGRGDSSRSFIESMRQQSFEALRLGVSLNDIVEINKKLLASYSGAMIISDRQAEKFDKQREAITNLVAFNQKFNVSQEESIKLLNAFNTSFGGGTKAAQSFSDSLLIFSQKTGQSALKVFGDFNAGLDRFSVLSADKAVSAFQRIQMVAARTGQEFSGVIQSLEKFDEIDTAFETGGKLNRILSFMGGSIDSFAMFQADEAERTKMLYESISGVSQQYSQLQTAQQKRAMAKQISEVSGVDFKTVVGLLNNATDLSRDISEIMSKPVITEEFTDKGREAAAMRLTTNEELKNIQAQLLDLNPIVAKLSDNVKENTTAFNKFFGKFVKGVDASLKPALEEGGAEGLSSGAKIMFEKLADLPSAFQRSMAEFQSTKAVTTDIISGNTKIISDLSTLLAKGINVKVEGKIDTPAGSAKVSGTGAPPKASAAGAMSSTPPGKVTPK